MMHNLFRLTHCAMVRMRHRRCYKSGATIKSDTPTSRVFLDSTLAYVWTRNSGSVYIADCAAKPSRVHVEPLSLAVEGKRPQKCT